MARLGTTIRRVSRVADFADPGKGVKARHALVGFGIVHRGLDDSQGDSVDPHATQPADNQDFTVELPTVSDEDSGSLGLPDRRTGPVPALPPPGVLRRP